MQAPGRELPRDASEEERSEPRSGGGTLRTGHRGKEGRSGWILKRQQTLVSKKSQGQKAVLTQLMKYPRSLLLLLY